MLAFHSIAGQGESAVGERPGEGGLQPSPSPDDLSSPNPDQAAPLLQAQQRTPSRTDKDEKQPGSVGGTAKTDAEITETVAVKEGRDIQGSLKDREPSGQERTAGKEPDRTEECESKDSADGETADEGLPPSKGSEDSGEEESEGRKEPPDANNNSLSPPQDQQIEFIDTPDSPAQVRVLPGVIAVTPGVSKFKEHVWKTPPPLLFLRPSRWRRRTAPMRSRWSWWTARDRGRRRLTWTTATP